MIISRRSLLKALGLSPLATQMISPLALAAQSNDRWKRTLILIELNGGNDGLNTVVPYRDPLYRQFRPKLAIGANKVLQLDETLGLHPALKPLMPLWRDNEVAVALGVGYPDANLSHFRSIDIWDTGSDSQDYLDQGWIAEAFMTNRPPKSAAAEGIVLGRNSHGPLYGPDMRAISLKKTKLLKPGKIMANSAPSSGQPSQTNPALAHILQTREKLQSASRAILSRHANKVDPGADFPKTDIGQQLKTIAQLIISGAGVPVYKSSLGGFDTHGNQAGKHARLLSQLSDAIAAFSLSMKKHDLWRDSLIMTYAEFGRRPKENASGGTDHGTAAPHFLIGGRVKGGLYGKQPPLDALNGKNLAHRLHYRRLYATVTREWWDLETKFITEKPLGCIA
jgi:uncharacterized protein (DUF1501 family)